MSGTATRDAAPALRRDTAPLSAARAFDAFLGRRDLAGGVVDAVRAIDLDEASAFPTEEIAAIDAWGLQRWYVPEKHGGRLVDTLDPVLMIRHLAGRDVTAAVAHGKTFLGSVCSWVAGGEIAETTADIALRGEPISWGLTEKGRGSDLSQSSTTARVEAREILLDGTKWPINNATRGRAVTVLARTSDAGGPRSLSLVFLDKAEVDPGTLSYEPKVATHGIRGADISGIRFSATRTAPERLVGQEGHGLELVLKSLQLTRPLTTALSLGAADQGLSIALSFARSRRLYGSLLIGLPAARRTLAEAAADTLIAECVMLVGARTIHSAPDEMAIVSALVKFLAPDTVDAMFRNLTSFLGARSQLVGFAGAGAFQKAARDNRVVGIFDGNSIVNLNVLINELPGQLRPADPPDLAALLAPLALSWRTSGLPAQSLRLVTRRGSSLLRAVPELVAAVTGRGGAEVAAAAQTIADAYRSMVEDAAALPRQGQPHPRAFRVAERLAVVFGGACAMAVYLARRDVVADHFADGAWLSGVLQRIAQRLGAQPLSRGATDTLLDAAVAAHETGVVSLLRGWSA
ncbi:acyl-CoA dehydrogenase family protein [Microbacterium sp. bgisy203]|uniref:acyl-CoA dehydrogenase family protein n=1 Tax=Microbacterium sp. bgisy203 TaxID=3413799 RepID=UPI003D750DA2